LRVRKFQIEDYEHVIDLWKAAGIIIRPGDDLEGIKTKLERDADLFLVAENGGQVIGTVLGGWDGRRGWIYHLAVRPDHRRKGVGTTLVRELEEKLAQKGAKKINAQIYEWNRASVEFFKTIGYDVHSDLIMIGKILK